MGKSLGLFFCLSLMACVIGHEERKPTLILISFDGFRWDYLYKVNAKTLEWLADNGVRATVINNFVTKTFPNHYSIVTGMYKENHGIINNVMWDPVYREKFTPSTTDPKWFNASEPIWITNEKGGDERLSAVINWVGGAVPIKGRRAYFSPPYNGSIPYKTRINMVLDQLDHDPPVNFVAAYFEEPDSSGHQFGPDSDQVKKAILKLDSITGYLVEELKKRNLFDQVNIILTSDHGMAEVDSSRIINLDNHISPDKYTYVVSDVNAFIIPHEGEKDNIYRNLSKVSHFTVFYKEDIPNYWHYRQNRRVTPIFVAGDLGYKILKDVNITHERGDHGYNNSLKQMHPFFIAYGPAFKQGYYSKPFSIVHIYSLMCHILGVKPAKNDGNLSAISHILRPRLSGMALLVVVVLVAAVVCVFILTGVMKNFQKPVNYQFHRLHTLDA